jgi:catalase (peroxidase I)
MAGKAHVKRKAGRKATKKKAKDVKKKVLGAGSSIGGGSGAEAAVSGLKGLPGKGMSAISTAPLLTGFDHRVVGFELVWS